jgi:hypothetical protein
MAKLSPLEEVRDAIAHHEECLHHNERCRGCSVAAALRGAYFEIKHLNGVIGRMKSKLMNEQGVLVDCDGRTRHTQAS